MRLSLDEGSQQGIVKLEAWKTSQARDRSRFQKASASKSLYGNWEGTCLPKGSNPDYSHTRIPQR